MAKVLQFPKKVASPPSFDVIKGAKRAKAAAAARGPGLRSVMSVAWMVLRLPLFLLLYWFRLPVMLVCNLISIPTLLAFLFSWYAFPDKTHMIAAFGVTSFVAFVVLWCYDYVLMSLSPQEMMRTL